MSISTVPFTFKVRGGEGTKKKKWHSQIPIAGNGNSFESDQENPCPPLRSLQLTLASVQSVDSRSKRRPNSVILLHNHSPPPYLNEYIYKASPSFYKFYFFPSFFFNNKYYACTPIIPCPVLYILNIYTGFCSQKGNFTVPDKLVTNMIIPFQILWELLTEAYCLLKPLEVKFPLNRLLMYIMVCQSGMKLTRHWTS